MAVGGVTYDLFDSLEDSFSSDLDSLPQELLLGLINQPRQRNGIAGNPLQGDMEEEIELEVGAGLGEGGECPVVDGRVRAEFVPFLEDSDHELAEDVAFLRRRLAVIHRDVLDHPVLKDMMKEDGPSTSDDVELLREQLKSLGSELASIRSALSIKGEDDTKSRTSRMSSRRGSRRASVSSQSSPGRFSHMTDLIHLAGPLTEDAILRTLQSRFYSGEYYTNIGPITVLANPYNCSFPDVALHADPRRHQPLHRVAKDTVKQQLETGHSQVAIFSGENGSGKTYSSQLLLRQLFDVAGGGPETDAFKHLSAAFTVLRSIGSAKTASNSESSRMGHFIEVHVVDGAIFRTKIHCYFIDQSRVVHPARHEKNFHIFYQMLAGLTPEERVKLHLQGYSAYNLKYLSCGQLLCDDMEDRYRFEAWRSSLSVLGIPFADVMRVLAAVLLLGNIEFVEGDGLELDVQGNNEIKSVAALLGVSGVSLYRGLTTRTHNVRGQVFKSLADAATANQIRDALAKALYSRTLNAIVRRANSVRRPASNSGTNSSDSSESVQNGHSGMTNGHHSYRPLTPATSKTSLHQSARSESSQHAMSEGVIGIVDMFGFEASECNQFEHLCMNLCAETLQHFYSTHVFRTTQQSARDEGVYCDVEIDCQDNAPCIELITCQRTGLLSLLDKEGAHTQSASWEGYLQRVVEQHSSHECFSQPECEGPDTSSFTIRHFTGPVTYDASSLLHTNNDAVPDDIICIFSRNNCNFGFVTHLYSNELKVQGGNGPQGMAHRISPPISSDSNGQREGRRTLSRDFQTRLDNLLKTIVMAKPHFVRCIRSNSQEEPELFTRDVVCRQIRALHILETVNLYAGGYPHRMRLKTFNNRFRFLVPWRRRAKMEDMPQDECKLILDGFLQAVDSSDLPYTSANWAIGKKHIFLSEGARQQLESVRDIRRDQAATLIQAYVRRRLCVKKWPSIRRSLELRKRAKSRSRSRSRSRSPHSARNRPQPIPVMENNHDRCDTKTIQQTCCLYGMDMDCPPPVPPSRGYTVNGNMKMSFPQMRVMKQGYPDAGKSDRVLRKGDSVKVVGVSPRRGYLIVEHSNTKLHVPYQLMELRTTNGLAKAC
ncbi:myosin-I heavy chain-like isoform X2 [Branchiostoma lanceolatum]|uniref:myosin-I heavy chain-like isoform X2 n=1 Tax=Branchiostoma lanceolatum TaxID=7740 RepID=UPI0034560A8E